MPVANERSHKNRVRAESFGTRAGQYDRARPGYPDALFDDLMVNLMVNRAGDRGRDVLDVGCGTGKAAVPLAARGLRVLGVEVDERMAAVARAHGIAIETAAFESWADAGRRFDLIVSGQAWHWVEPARGAQRAAELLRPGGQLALFWNLGGHDARVQRRLDAVYAAIVPDMPSSVLSGGSGTLEPYLGPLHAAGFRKHVTRDYDWRHTYSRAEWLDLLATHSDHATLPGDVFARLRDRIGELVDALGGSITIDYTTRLLLASQ